jgi:hypothetical protein
MPKRYPQEAIEAIWALLCDGLGPAAIERELASGAATGSPVNMPQRTLSAHVKRLRLERGDPRHAVTPGHELETARAIRRAALEMLGQQLERLRSQARIEAPKPMSSRDLEALRKLAQTADEIANREAKLPPDPERASTGAQGAARRRAEPKSLLAGIAAGHAKTEDPAARPGKTPEHEDGPSR